MADNTQSDIKKYENLLKQSKTAYTSGVKPTIGDINAQVNLMRAKKEQEKVAGEALKEQWYTEKKGESGQGYLTNVLHGLAAPLYGIVGATEAVLGKGTEKGAANIVANIKEKGTFGDLIRSYNVPNSVAMPAGFLMDIAMDPLNWVTLGASALIPRVAGGIIKGGVAGGKVALKSGALTKLESAGRLVPGLSKKAFAGASVEKGPLAKGYASLVEKAESSRAAYNDLLGKSLNDALEKSVNKESVFDNIETLFSRSRIGQKLIDFFDYDNAKWFREAKEKSLATRGISPSDIVKGQSDDWFFDAPTMVGKEIEEASDLIVRPELGRSKNSLENTYRLAGEFEADKAFKSGVKQELNRIIPDKEAVKQTYESGVKWYDNLVDKAIKNPIGRKILGAYATYLGIFKGSKIGLSPATWMNALVGNLTMAKMAGFDVFNADHILSMKNALKIIKSKNINDLRPLFGENWSRWMEMYPEVFRDMLGVDPYLILGGERYLFKVSENLKTLGKNMQGSDEVYDAFRKANDEVRRTAGAGRSTVETSLLGQQPTTFLSGEVMVGAYGNFVNKIKASADKGNSAAKAFYWYLTKPMEGYSKVDQTYRLGMAMHLVNNGITEKELRLVSKRFPIGKDDISKVTGRNLYKLSPDKAMELTGEIYMNYAAMPAFVKIMRTMPILGSPFISFSYGMLSQTAKAAAYNPEIFNKIQFLLKEIGGNRSPLEKQALESQYYQWYNKEGMTKMPFFEENPMYLNVENWIPYYTMNIFQPTERSYEDKFGGAVTKLVDKLPFLKTPDGQIMFDYLIQPMILSESQVKGSFDQPLWSKDAGFGEKVGRAGLALAESVVPPSAGYLGLVTPEAAAPYLPSFRWRQLAYAKEGKGSLGVPTKEPPSEKTLRVMAAMTGFPYYKLKLQYANQ